MKVEGSIVIVGGGVVGAAIFHHLSKTSKRDVVLLEKNRLSSGATGASGGIVRIFHDDPYYMQMAIEGKKYYEKFESNTGTNVTFNVSGALNFICPERVSYAKDQVSLSLPENQLEWLSPAAGRSRFPHISWDDVAGAVYEPSAGFLDPKQVSAAWVAHGVQNGGRFHEGVCVESLVIKNNELVGVATNLGVYPSQHVILCAGAWMEKLIAQLNLDFPVEIFSKAIQLEVFESVADAWPFPAFSDSLTGLYGRHRGAKSIYIGSPVEQFSVDPDIMPMADILQQNKSREIGINRFPWLSGSIRAGSLKSSDAYTPTGAGVAGASSKMPGVYWATGFSGGGFKIAPSIARQMSELIGIKQQQSLLNQTALLPRSSLGERQS